MSKYEYASWVNLNEGDIITLKDMQTIDEARKQGIQFYTNGVDFTIKRKRVYTTTDGKTAFTLFDIEVGKMYWYLLVKSVDGTNFDVKCLYRPDDMPEGNRQDLLNVNLHWLFQEPADTNNFKIGDLEFTLGFDQQTANGSVTQFTLQGKNYGESTQDGDKFFASILEYKALSQSENPDFIIFEINATTDQGEGQMSIDCDNSYIIMMFGCPISLADLEILK